MGLLRRLPLEAGIEVLLPVTVVLFALGSTSVPSLVSAGHRGRWVALVALAVLALAAAAARGRPPRTVPLAWTLAALLVGLGAVSAAWSVNRHLTIGRVFTLGILFAASASLALCWSSGPTEAARRVQRGVLAGIGVVALASLVLVVVRRSDAVLSATAGAGWRFQGLEENPDTLGMLLAVGLPLAAAAAVRGSARSRVFGFALVLLFAGEVASSGSRGALLAGFAGAIVVVALLASSPGRRLGWTATLVALAVVCAVTPKLQGSVQVVTAPPASAARVSTPTRGINAELAFRLQDELGHPPLGAYRPPVPRTLLGSSGRAEAWAGAVRQGKQRPILGYGFGTEDKVFVDRFYAFEGLFPEDTYVGLFLQIGAAGLAVFGALLLVLGRDAFRARAVPPAAAAAGVLVAAVLIGVTQSGLLAVGNLAVSAVWLTLAPLPLLARAAA